MVPSNPWLLAAEIRSLCTASGHADCMHFTISLLGRCGILLCYPPSSPSSADTIHGLSPHGSHDRLSKLWENYVTYFFVQRNRRSLSNLGRTCPSEFGNPLSGHAPRGCDSRGVLYFYGLQTFNALRRSLCYKSPPSPTMDCPVQLLTSTSFLVLFLPPLWIVRMPPLCLTLSLSTPPVCLSVPPKHIPILIQRNI